MSIREGGCAAENVAKGLVEDAAKKVIELGVELGSVSQREKC